MALIFNLSYWEADAGGSFEFKANLELKFRNTQGYIDPFSIAITLEGQQGALK